MHNFTNKAKSILLFSFFVSFLLITNYIYASWTPPPQNPPSGNTLAPINAGVSGGMQSISGALGIDNLVVNGSVQTKSSNSGYVNLSPDDGSIELGSGNDLYSYIDFHANNQLAQDYGGRLVFNGTDFNLQNSAGWTNLNVIGGINSNQVCINGVCQQTWPGKPTVGFNLLHANAQVWMGGTDVNPGYSSSALKSDWDFCFLSNVYPDTVHDQYTGNGSCTIEDWGWSWGLKATVNDVRVSVTCQATCVKF